MSDKDGRRWELRGVDHDLGAQLRRDGVEHDKADREVVSIASQVLSNHQDERLLAVIPASGVGCALQTLEVCHVVSAECHVAVSGDGTADVVDRDHAPDPHVGVGRERHGQRVRARARLRRRLPDVLDHEPKRLHAEGVEIKLVCLGQGKKLSHRHCHSLRVDDKVDGRATDDAGG
eukprot:3017349-Rhodomonas_salina.1